MGFTTGILLFDDVEELDFAGPWEILTSAAALEKEDRVVTIAEKAGPNPAVIEWLKKVGEGCRFVTSVCTGTLLLHEAGFARGKRVTTHWGFVETLRQRGDVTVLDDVRFVRDGNLVTSAGISAGIDMTLYLVGQLHTPELARKVQRYVQYDPSPPYTAEV
jgi:transcriptional regulator GlxA family with amidase domain